jgi:hypothetical protein
MPGLLPPSPYDPVETVLNFARIIANDCALSIDGNLLADTQPYIYPMLNLAWRKLQDRLGNNAIEDFPAEEILHSITPVDADVDQATQAYISFNGYYDGKVINAMPVLPPDLQEPVKLWERPSGTNLQFVPMTSAEGGIPAGLARGAFFGVFEWREDILYLVGSNRTNDIRIRYIRKMPDITSGNATTTPVPIIRCAVALAYLLVEIFSTSRGGTVTPAFSSEREGAIKQLINTTTRKKQRTNFRRLPYSRRR